MITVYEEKVFSPKQHDSSYFYSTEASLLKFLKIYTMTMFGFVSQLQHCAYIMRFLISFKLNYFDKVYQKFVSNRFIASI